MLSTDLGQLVTPRAPALRAAARIPSRGSGTPPPPYRKRPARGALSSVTAMKFAEGGDVGYPRPGVMAEPIGMEPERFVPKLPGFVHMAMGGMAHPRGCTCMACGGGIGMADGGSADEAMREKVAALKSIDTGGVQPWSAGENFPMFVYRAGLPGGGEGFRGSYLHAQDYEKAPTPYRRTYDEALQDAQNLLKMFRAKKLPKFQRGGLANLINYTNRGLKEAQDLKDEVGYRGYLRQFHEAQDLERRRAMTRKSEETSPLSKWRSSVASRDEKPANDAYSFDPTDVTMGLSSTRGLAGLVLPGPAMGGLSAMLYSPEAGAPEMPRERGMRMWGYQLPDNLRYGSTEQMLRKAFSGGIGALGGI